MIDEDEMVVRIEGRKLVPDISLPWSATVLDLKEHIQFLLDVKIERQTLKANGEVLVSDQIVGEEYIHTVFLEVSPLAGDPEFEIVLDYEGEEIKVRVKETTLVGELKGKIERRWGSPGKHRSLHRLSLVGNQSFLLYRLSTQMEDHLPLSAYYVSEGSRIEVKTR